MQGVVFVFFSLSVVLFLGMGHYFVALNRTGVYPPKNILKKRAGAFATGGTFFLVLGSLFLYFK